MPPVLPERAFLRLSKRDMTLIREANLSLMAMGGCVILPQFAVDAKANPIVVFVRFKVQVGGARVDGVDQHLLEKPDDWSVFDILRRISGLLG